VAAQATQRKSALHLAKLLRPDHCNGAQGWLSPCDKPSTKVRRYRGPFAGRPTHPPLDGLHRESSRRSARRTRSDRRAAPDAHPAVRQADGATPLLPCLGVVLSRACASPLRSAAPSRPALRLPPAPPVGDVLASPAQRRGPHRPTLVLSIGVVLGRGHGPRRLVKQGLGAP
jgi:hypothetical protein